jgi:hypothetical protein
MTAERLKGRTWRKSSHSNSNSNCIEIASAGGNIAVRDSKDPDGPVLIFGADQWQAFLTGITAGELDLK